MCSSDLIATVPAIDKEGAYALGATRWEMIRGAVWPHSQGGVVGAVLVGFGRAMGETIAVALVIGDSIEVTSHTFYSGQSIASGVSGIPVLDNLFGSPTSGTSFFTAAIVLAIMITPIITSLSREVIATVPTTDKEGAYALGATRWEMIRGAVWPHSQGGVVGAILVGLGRAMGETIAAALLIGSVSQVTPHLFAPGYSIPAAIANLFPEASGEFRSALIGLGLFLFVITILVNLVARGFVERSARRMRGAS